MRRRLSWFRTLARIGVLAGFWLITMSDGRAQQTAPTRATLPAPVVSPENAVPSQKGTDPPTPTVGVPPGSASVIPGETVVLPTPDGTCPDGGCPAGFDWKKVPPVRIFPPPGNFPVPPTGCGYYSLWDFITDTERKDRPKFPYSAVSPMFPSFFDADFRYLDDPKNTQHAFSDPLHRIRLGDDWMFDTGGELRWRHMHEVNSRLLGPTNDYDLYRARVYGDLWYKDVFRVYAEFLYADSVSQNLLPALIDVNRGDLLNAFVDIKLLDLKGYNAYLRVGRQEMLLGSERLISPLDWANTRRTFQGVRAFRQGEKFDVDIFWVQPIIPDPKRFDSVDNNINFWGLWTTYRPRKGQFLDLYYLGLDNTSRVTLLGLDRSPATTHTFGGRYAGTYKNFLWDFEQDVQIGDRGHQEVFSAATSNGVGWNFKHAPWNPTFWIYYDYATGTGTGDGNFHTFNQLFPFGHYYLGFLDLVGRQNIQDLQGQFYLYPTKWIVFNAQFHHFNLANAHDALYNSAGVPIRRDATGKAGQDVGDELDLVMNFHLTAHSDILVGYSKLYAGDFIRNTAPLALPGSGGSAELFYVQYSFRW